MEWLDRHNLPPTTLARMASGGGGGYTKGQEVAGTVQRGQGAVATPSAPGGGAERGRKGEEESATGVIPGTGGRGSKAPHR